MEMLDGLTVYHGSEESRFELYRGDLSAMPSEEAVDVLVLSAFPDDYTPTPQSLIGALAAKGVSLADLAEKKSVDLRENYACWLSEDIISSEPGIQFKRILCFEPRSKGYPPEVVGDIFQGLISLIEGDYAISSIAMPLVASGDQYISVADMLEPLFDAAVHWQALGLSINRIKIVQHSELKAAEMKGAFSILKKQYSRKVVQPSDSFNYDVFISYSHDNAAAVDFLLDEMKRINPNLKIFLDRKELNTGVAWQQEIFEALDDCRKVVAFYSPAYLSSKICREEFNIAMFRHRESKGGVLLPIYLHTANLPTYMKVMQYTDCCEADKAALQSACKQICEILAEDANLKPPQN
jgi:hypothetical protein